MPSTLSYYRRNITSQNWSSPTSIIKVIIPLEWTLRLLNYDRTTAWIVNGREEIKRWTRECNVCKLGRRHRSEQIMAPLPEARLGTSLSCFAHCGVDFAGPFVIEQTRKVTAKSYLCLFTCASTWAVHLEIAYSLDTASFLMHLPEWSPDVENRRWWSVTMARTSRQLKENCVS